MEISSASVNMTFKVPLVINAPTNLPLITLDDYKAYAGITGVKEDDKLNRIIPSISKLVKSYCNNPVIDYYWNNLLEYFDIQWETYTVQLKYSPIVGVAAVYERLTQDSDYTALVEGEDYYIDHVSDSILRTTVSGRYQNFPQGTGSVLVSYRSGYPTTPEDLKLALVDLITYYLKDERKDRRTLGAASIAYPRNADGGNFPDYIKRVLDIYKIW